jgi:hypothetical protein
MDSPSEDGALGWAGDDDPTLQVGTGTAVPGAAGDYAVGEQAPGKPPEGWTVAGPASAVQAQEASDEAAGTPVGSFALIAMGVFGGIYLLYTIGWIIGITRIENPLSDAVGRFMFSLGLWLAVAAPAVWFGATFWLTRTRPRARLAALLIGVVLLAPLPFIINAGGAS